MYGLLKYMNKNKLIAILLHIHIFWITLQQKYIDYE